MNVFVGLLLAGAVLWFCVRFIRRHAPVSYHYSDDDADTWSMRRSEPRATPQERDTLHESLLRDCPPDPCPEVLYEHLKPAGQITHAELTRRGKAIFAAQCCGSQRIDHEGTLVCSACDALGYLEESE